MMLGKEVTGKDFVDREKTLKEMSAIVSRNNISIYGPRRIGKSSLMLEFARRNSNKYASARLDVRRIIPLSHKNFIKSLGMTFIDIYGKTTGEKLIPFVERLKRDIPDILSRLQVGITDWLELSVAPTTDISGFIKKTFVMGETMAERADKNFLVLIDEIPALVRMTGGRANPQDVDFLWALRGYFNEARRVHYIVSGSEVGMMEFLSGSKESPLYGSFVPVKLAGLESIAATKFVGKFVQKRFICSIIEDTACFPMYLQAYSLAARLGAKTIDDIRTSAFDLLHLHFKDLQNHLSPQQQLILKIMAEENIATVGTVKSKTNLPYATVYANLKRMETTGFLRKKKESEYEFIDPLFQKWLALAVD
jgi:AAA+ ATPase superfamily predicted ATPase